MRATLKDPFRFRMTSQRELLDAVRNADLYGTAQWLEYQKERYGW